MRAWLPIVLAAATAAWLPAAPAAAWGGSGHEFVTGIAGELFPEEIPAFLRTPDAVQILGFYALEPDRNKHTSESAESELGAAHYVLLSDDKMVGGILPFADLPQTREAYAARLQEGGSSQYKAGYLPYVMITGWHQLVKDLAFWRAASVAANNAAEADDRVWFDRNRRYRELLILRDLGIWSHFTGDASMPLHTSVHFHGWGSYPNPLGFSRNDDIDVYIKGLFVRRHVTRDAVKRATPGYAACDCSVRDRTMRLILQSNGLVTPMYDLQRRGGFRDATPEAVDMVTIQLARGAAAVRDMVVDAWRASTDEAVGTPAVSLRDVLSGKQILRPDQFRPE
ncbi:MAG: hypothetical protein U1E60_19155 [Reyranellaceae bacterium]